MLNVLEIGCKFPRKYSNVSIKIEQESIYYLIELHVFKLFIYSRMNPIIQKRCSYCNSNGPKMNELLLRFTSDDDDEVEYQHTSSGAFTVLNH